MVMTPSRTYCNACDLAIAGKAVALAVSLALITSDYTDSVLQVALAVSLLNMPGGPGPLAGHCCATGTVISRLRLPGVSPGPARRAHRGTVAAVPQAPGPDGSCRGGAGQPALVIPLALATHWQKSVSFMIFLS